MMLKKLLPLTFALLLFPTSVTAPPFDGCSRANRADSDAEFYARYTEGVDVFCMGCHMQWEIDAEEFYTTHWLNCYDVLNPLHSCPAVYTCKHTCIHAFMHARKHTCTHTILLSHTHTLAHTLTHTHTHTNGYSSG